MKRPTRTIPAAFAVMALGLMTGSVMASITGSKHDFAAANANYPAGWSGGEICKPCHAPHNTTPTNAAGGVLQGPLWNHTLGPNNTYKMYINGTATDGQAVDQNSILCLSCHDGSIAIDSFGGATGTTTIQGKANLGTDLTNDHPIGQAALWPTPNPSYMVDPALRNSAGIMPLRAMTDGTLAVGCTSCHEPHDRANRAGVTNPPKHMLWVANDAPGTTVDGRAVTGSVLCMNCHKK